MYIFRSVSWFCVVWYPTSLCSHARCLNKSLLKYFRKRTTTVVFTAEWPIMAVVSLQIRLFDQTVCALTCMLSWTTLNWGIGNWQKLYCSGLRWLRTSRVSELLYLFLISVIGSGGKYFIYFPCVLCRSLELKPFLKTRRTTTVYLKYVSVKGKHWRLYIAKDQITGQFI